MIPRMIQLTPPRAELFPRHERLHEPGGVRKYPQLRRIFLVVPRDAVDSVRHDGAAPGRAEDRPRAGGGLRHGISFARITTRTRMADRANGPERSRAAPRA